MKKKSEAIFILLVTGLLISSCETMQYTTIKDKDVISTTVQTALGNNAPSVPNPTNPIQRPQVNSTIKPGSVSVIKFEKPDPGLSLSLKSPSPATVVTSSAIVNPVPEVSLSIVPANISIQQCNSNAVRVFIKSSDKNILKTVADNLKIDSGNSSVIKIEGIQVINSGEIMVNLNAVSSGNTKIKVTYKGKSYESYVSVFASSESSGSSISAAKPALWSIIKNGADNHFSEGEAVYTSMAFNNGVPYVVYRDSTDWNGRLMKYESGVWSIIKNGANNYFTAGSMDYPSLAINNGIPYIAYQDSASGVKGRLMKYEGGVWSVIKKGANDYFSLGSIDCPSLAFKDEVPYIAYKDSGDGVGRGYLTKYEGGAWSIIKNGANDYFSVSSVDAVSMAMNNGVPYIAYVDNVNGKARLIKYEGGVWTIMKNGANDHFSEGTVMNMSLAINNGVPYVAYKDSTNFKARLMKYEGGVWTILKNGPDNDFSEGTANYISLAINNGVPYVAYLDDTDKSRLMKYEGGAWSIIKNGTNNYFSEDVGVYMTLRINNGVPYIAYRDSINNKARLIKYE